MRILFFDLENTPIEVLTWGLYEQNAVAMLKDWELLSVAYCWGNETAITVVDRERQKTDKQLTKTLWKLLDKADVVVAHNAAEFDVKKANSKFAQYGLGPPSPYAIVDTLKIARSRFRFTSNKLDDLAKRLGVSRKMQTGGIELWRGCMANKVDSWNKMRQYNKQDIVVLRGVYERLAPFALARQHPNLANSGKPQCPRCASLKVRRRGMSSTLVNRYWRYYCNSCGYWSRARVGIKKGIIPKLVGL